MTIFTPVSKLMPEPTDTNTGLMLSDEVFTAAPNVLPYFNIPIIFFIVAIGVRKSVLLGGWWNNKNSQNLSEFED